MQCSKITQCPYLGRIAAIASSYTAFKATHSPPPACLHDREQVARERPRPLDPLLTLRDRPQAPPPARHQRLRSERTHSLTGSDTSSNILFGNLQKITSEQLGLSPILMAAANSSGGVMGKMIDAQSIVVASTATNWYGHEGSILRYVFLHSIVLACLVGLFVMLQAYVYPFTLMVLK